MKPQDLPIRDIKPLLPIPDVSIYLTMGLGLAFLLVVVAGAIFLRKWWQAHKRRDPRIVWLKKLDAVEYEKPKEAAYLMTRYGRLLAEDKRRQEILAQLLPRLERYKYKRDVPPLDEETKRYMQLFIEMCHDAL